MHIHDIIAIAIGLVACVFDLRTRRIPNVLTLGAALAAFLVAAGTGLTAFGSSVTGWSVALLLWLPLYALGGMGAGDVKLIAALGAWLGPTDVSHAALYAAVAGAVFAVVIAVVRGRARQTWTNIVLLLTYWRVAGLRPYPGLTLETTDGPKLAYAIPILAGTVMAIWLR